MVNGNINQCCLLAFTLFGLDGDSTKQLRYTIGITLEFLTSGLMGTELLALKFLRCVNLSITLIQLK